MDGIHFDRMEGSRGNFGGPNRCVVLAWIEDTSKAKKITQDFFEDVLSARSQVPDYGITFEEKVIICRGQRVITLRGENMVIEERKILLLHKNLEYFGRNTLVARKVLGRPF